MFIFEDFFFFEHLQLRNIIGFGNPPVKIGFPKLFEAFRMEVANLNIDFYRVSGRIPLSKNGFPTVFWVSGKPGNPVVIDRVAGR